MAIPYTFKQLRYFIEVAQQGNISEASRKLFVSQPSVSTAISQLESLLDESLFSRNAGQGVTLTLAGQEILKEAREIISRSENIKNCITQNDSQISGSLSLTCFRDIAPYFMPKLISKFSNLLPKVNVTLTEVDLKEVSHNLMTGRTEIGISYDLGLDKSIKRHELAELPPYVLLPKGHPLCGETSIDLKDLKDEPLILENLPITQEYFLSLFWSIHLKPTIKFYADSFETQRGLVAHGFGIALSCTRPENDTSYDGHPIVCVPLRGNLHHPKIVLAHIEGSEGTIIAQKFISLAKDTYRL